jgi:transposase
MYRCKKVYENQNDILQLYKNGLSTNEIAKKYDCSVAPIIKILKEHNALRTLEERNKLAAVKRTGKSRPSLRKQNFSDEKVIELYKSGLSSYEIGKIVGLSYSGVDKILKKHGVPKRTIKEAINIKIKKGTFVTPWKPMEQHCNWKGGRIEDARSGYVRVKAPWHPRANSKGYVFEHILVCEQKIGRFLEPGEVVHHINGIRNDNRPENLINLPERQHAKISGKQAAKTPKLKDILQQKIRELEQEISELKNKLNSANETSKSNCSS